MRLPQIEARANHLHTRINYALRYPLEPAMRVNRFTRRDFRCLRRINPSGIGRLSLFLQADREHKSANTLQS